MYLTEIVKGDENFDNFGSLLNGNYKSIIGLYSRKLENLDQKKMTQFMRQKDKEFIAKHPGAKPKVKLTDEDVSQLIGWETKKDDPTRAFSGATWNKFFCKKIAGREVVLNTSTCLLHYKKGDTDSKGNLAWIYLLYTDKNGELLRYSVTVDNSYFKN